MDGKSYRRLSRRRQGRMAVTPKMLVKALLELRKTNLFGIYFRPAEVAKMIAFKYPPVEQNFEELLQEVKDKLMCAASADLIGLKLGSGYYALTMKSELAQSGMRSELTFWMLYKKVLEERRLTKRTKKYSLEKIMQYIEDMDPV